MPSDSAVASDVRTDLARWRPRRQQRSEVFVPAAGSSQPGRSAGILRSHPRRFLARLLRLLHAFLCSPVRALIIRTFLYDDEVVIAMNGNNIAIHGRRFIVVVLPFFIIQPVD